MPKQPSDVVQQTLGIRLLASLGGRLNQHWLVEAKRTHMVLRRWYQSPTSIAYELLLMSRLAAMGWPVALPVEAPVEVEGHVWSLAPFLPGDPPSQDDPIAEQRTRGRLLATLHKDMAQLPESGQREGWRRCEEILADVELDHVLTLHEWVRPEEVRILRWHLERARERISGLEPQHQPGQIVHGDFTTWNLRFANGHLSGILDFELAHWDHRVGDFALSWRGKYDDVVYGYAEVSPLEPQEWALLTPLWWASLISGACQDMQNGTQDDGWTIRKLLQRSTLMGPDAAEFR